MSATATPIRSMRDEFLRVLGELVAEDDRVVAVVADISAAQLAVVAAAYPGRVVNVGIREQLMVGVAGGFALEGFRPVVHSYAPFLVERPFEQLKIALSHQGAGAVLVSIGASYDAAAAGRTHQAPEDVALIDALPGWTVHVPGHPADVEPLLRGAVAAEGCVYVRLAAASNEQPSEPGPGLAVVRRGARGTVLAVGPMLDRTVAAARDLDVTVLHATTVRPLDTATLVATLGVPSVALVEPYLAGTSAAVVSDALRDVPHRLLALGVPRVELRRYGSAAEHDAAHGLDVAGLRRSLSDFFGRG